MESGWSSKLSLLLWNEKKIICTWSWTHANVRVYDIICDGHCSGCKAKIKCVATPNGLRFTITNFNSEFKHEPHKKRRVLNVDMAELQAKLDGKSVKRVRAEIAAGCMSFGDPDPPVVSNSPALRKSKARIDCSEVNAFKSLSFLAKKHPKTIHSIGYDPFFIIYMTPLQKALYKGDFMRSKRTRISIDSTG